MSPTSTFPGMELDEETLVIVDGRTGEIIINPSPETLQHYQQLYDKAQHPLACP